MYAFFLIQVIDTIICHLSNSAADNNKCSNSGRSARLMVADKNVACLDFVVDVVLEFRDDLVGLLTNRRNVFLKFGLGRKIGTFDVSF